MPTFLSLVPAALLSLFASGPSAPAPEVVTLIATDYAFEAPSSVTAGWLTFRMENRGAEAHHVTFIRLDDGRTMDDLFQAFESGDATPEWAVAVGGPNGVAPGDVSEATLFLRPGRYAVLCFIPSPGDHVPHLMKGMATEMEVTPPAGGAADMDVRAPEVDIEMRLIDFAVSLDRPVGPGLQTFRVTADPRSTEPHEVLLARLAPGAEPEALLHWLSTMDSPPPAHFLGGITALSPGESGYFTADLEPGRYVWVCPLEAGPGSTPHHERGMYQPFTVEAPDGESEHGAPTGH